MKNEYGFEVIALTQGPKHHFFGYYDIQTWDSTGRHVRWIAFDSVHEGSRQVYALDASPAG